MKTSKKRFSATKVVLISIIAILVIVIGLAIVAIVVVLPSGSKSKDPSALLSEINGVVEVRNSGQNPFNPVNDGFLLKAIMQLQTKEQSRVRLDLSTGSIVRLGQLTIFSLDQPGTANGGVLSRIQLQVGRVWVILKGGSLDVNTPAGLASVRGSYMSVWVEPNTNRITVCCLEGQCEYKNDAGTVELTSGQKIVSSDINVVPPIDKMDQTDVQSWLDNSPEAIAIVPQITALVASSTPFMTPTSTNGTPTDTTATASPDLSNLAASGTPTLINSLTPTPTLIASLTPTLTLGIVTFTPTLLYTPTRTPTPTLLIIMTFTPTVTPTATRVITPTVTYTPPPTRTPTSTPFPTRIVRPTSTPKPTSPAYP